MDALTDWLAAPFASAATEHHLSRRKSLSADAHSELAAYAATLSPRVPDAPSPAFVEPSLPSPGRLVHLAPKLAPHQARPTAADAAALMAALHQQPSPRSSGSAPPPTPVLPSAAVGNLLVNGGLPVPHGYMADAMPEYQYHPQHQLSYPSETLPTGSFSAPPWQQSYHHVNYPTHYADLAPSQQPQPHYGHGGYHQGYPSCTLARPSRDLRCSHSCASATS